MRTLSLRQAGLEEVPADVFAHADTLEQLDLGGNRLRSLPPAFSKLTRLKRLFLSENPFVELPRVLGTLPRLEMVGFKSCALEHVPEDALPERLRWLILTDNKLTSLPESLGARPLQKVALAGNRLTSLPQSLASTQTLELLRISANALPAFPPQVLALPRLRWLAFAGNPFCATPAVAPRDIPWASLDVQEQLGTGASGDIFRATWTETGEAVAVKRFKGAVTSDGWPEDEQRAWLLAGAHPGLVQVHGRVVGHPEGAQALVLSLVPPHFRALGQPPDFDTCTRDVMTGAVSPAQAERIVEGVSEVMQHLAARGISHGDLYAHNIRVDAAGTPVVGDFGAASVLRGLSPEVCAAVLTMEQRALAVLRDDLAQVISR